MGRVGSVQFQMVPSSSLYLFSGSVEASSDAESLLTTGF